MDVSTVILFNKNRCHKNINNKLISDNSSSYNNKNKQKHSRNITNDSAYASLIAIIVTILCALITKCDATSSANSNIAQPAANLLDVKPVNYSVWDQNVTYLSSSTYNNRGMGPLYNISNTIINLFVDDDEPIPRGKFKTISIFYTHSYSGYKNSSTNCFKHIDHNLADSTCYPSSHVFLFLNNGALFFPATISHNLV